MKKNAMNSSIGRLFIAILVIVPMMAIVQAGILEPLLPSFPNLNIVLPLVIAIASVQPTPVGALAAFLAGLLSDIGVGLVLGPQAGASVVVWLLIALVSNRVYVESRATLVILALIASTVFSLARLAFTLQFLPSATQSVVSIIGEATFTAIVTILVTPALRSLLSPKSFESQRDFPSRRRSTL